MASKGKSIRCGSSSSGSAIQARLLGSLLGSSLSQDTIDLSFRDPSVVTALWRGAGRVLRIRVEKKKSEIDGIGGGEWCSSSSSSMDLPAHLPSTLIVKAIDSKAKLTSVQVDSYRVEQSFYENFSDDLDVAIPSCYLFGENDTSSSDGTSATSSATAIKKRHAGRKTKKRKGKRKGGGGRGSDGVAEEDDGFSFESSAAWRFYSVLGDLSTRFPLQVEDVSLPQARACLSWMARFHGRFMGLDGCADAAANGSRDFDRLRGLWRSGTFWTLDRRRSELAQMQRTYETEFARRVAREYPSLKNNIGVANLAKRLRACAELLHGRLSVRHAKNRPSHFTICHGDMKGANIKLRLVELPEGAKTKGEAQYEAAVLDWQWTGGGLGARDLAYFFISAVDPAYGEKFEMDLLRAYYDERKAIVTKRFRTGRLGKLPKKDAIQSWDDFVEVYECALCDFMRWLCGYGLWGGPAEKWSLTRVSEILTRRGWG